MATSSNAVRVDAELARNLVVDGQKNVADAQARYTALGGGSGTKLDLLRDGSLSGSVAITLTITGRVIRAVQSGAWTSLANADKDTGTWVGRLTNSSDSTRYIDFAVPADITISADLTTGGVGSLTPIDIQCPAYDTEVNVYPLSNDSRTFAYVDPRLTWANQPAAVAGGFGGREVMPQINPNWSSGAAYVAGTSGNQMWMLPESGVVSGGITVFNRVVDPADSAKRAILHRVHPSAATLGGTARSAFNTPAALPYNVDHWFAFSCRWPTWPGRYSTIFDVHDNTWEPGPFGRVTPETQSPIQLQMGTDGKYRWQVTGCYVTNYQRSDVTRSFSSYSAAISAGSGTASGWHHWILRARIARSLAQSPSLTVYHAVDGGALSTEYSLSATPIGFYDTPIDNLYPKLGLYQFDLPAVDSSMHTKGLFVFRDAAGTPTITAAGVLALLRSV